VVALAGCASESPTEETGLLPTPRADAAAVDASSPIDAAASASDASVVADAGSTTPADATAPVDAGAPRDASVVTDARVDAGAPVVDAAVPFEAGPLTDAGTIAWNISASQADPPGTRLSFFCGANPTQTGTSSVWGTDVYSYDSSICKAGVHAGKITFAAGGAVRIEMRGDAATFTGSLRNGVTSESWPVASKSFVFLP
jgi:hypothetical protein